MVDCIVLSSATTEVLVSQHLTRVIVFQPPTSSHSGIFCKFVARSRESTSAGGRQRFELLATLYDQNAMARVRMAQSNALKRLLKHNLLNRRIS